jgi:HEAT repeat protein
MRSLYHLTVAGALFGIGTGLCAAVVYAAAPANATDEEVLRAANIGSTGTDLLAFFRKRTLGQADVARIGPLVKQLGAAGFRARKQAKAELIQLGPPALSELRRLVEQFDGLKRPLTDSELESRNRAAECVDIIAKNPGPGLPLAALRVLELRKPDGCCQVLLGYLPFADNKEVEEEVMEALLFHGRKDGKADPALLSALKDKHPLRRAGAGYALARMGDPTLRPSVRALLTDADAKVRQWVAYGLVGKEIYRSAEAAAKTDQGLFETHKLPADDAGLLAFFRKRTLSEADQARLKDLVADLGSKIFRKRGHATRALIAAGSPALPFLRAGLTSADVEIATRARACITEIETGPGKALASAGARQLLRRAPAQGLETLLGYIPFADNDDVEQEVLHALCALAVREVQVSPSLFKALGDGKPARRSAAAHVLGRVAGHDDCKPVRALLADVDPKVRFQAVQVALASRDKAAIPVLVALLDEGPLELGQKAEDLLGTITGAQPTKGELTADKTARKNARTAWSAWWQANQAKVNLASAVPDTPLARAEKARKVCLQTLDAMVQLNVAGFKKNLKYPFYMEGMSPTGEGLIKGPEQIDQFFKMLEGIKEFKQQIKQMTFKVTHVGRLEEYLEVAQPREKGFLDKLRKPEMYIVYISLFQRGVAQPGGGGAMFVRLTGGRAYIVGLGNPRPKGMGKK